MENREIEKINFLSGEGNNRAVIVYTDGQVEIVDIKTASEKIAEMAKQLGLTTMSEVKDFLTYELSDNEKEEVANKLLENKIEEEKQQEEEEDLTPDLDDLAKDLKNKGFGKMPKSNDLAKKYKIAKVVLGGLIGAVLVSGVIKGVKSVNSFFRPTTQTDYDDQHDNSLNQETNADVESGNNITSAINQKNINEEKKEFITPVWKYLKNYNSDIANKFREKKKNTKLALRWDEVVAQNLIYNHYDLYTIRNIFDTYEFDADILYNAYKESLKQEKQAHIIQTSTFDKSDLIEDEAGQEFYMDYESIVVNFNIQTSIKRKEEVASEFFAQLRKDFDFNVKDYDIIESYKLSITPIVNAMNKMCKNLKIEGKLTKEELDYFNDEAFNKLAKEKLETYESYLKNSGITTPSNELSFEDVENIAMKEMEENDLYDVSDSKRDISNYKTYQENISWKSTSNTKHDNDDNKEKKQTKSPEKNKEQEKDEEEKNQKIDQKKDKQKKEEKQKDKNNTKNQENNQNNSETSADQQKNDSETETNPSNNDDIDDSNLGREEEEETENQDQEIEIDVEVEAEAEDSDSTISKASEENQIYTTTANTISSYNSSLVDSNTIESVSSNTSQISKEELVDQMLYAMEHPQYDEKTQERVYVLHL